MNALQAWKEAGRRWGRRAHISGRKPCKITGHTRFVGYIMGGMFFVQGSATNWAEAFEAVDEARRKLYADAGQELPE